MPNITLTVSVAEGARIAAALEATDYPPTLAGFKALLVDYTRAFVKEWERAKAEKAALATATVPPPLAIS